jgi:hypothetical protein
VKIGYHAAVVRTLITACVAGAAVGCMQIPQMAAADLAGRAERNMVEAQQNLAGRQLIVSGVVKETTLATRSQVVSSGHPHGWTRTAVQRDEQIPLVILQPGSILCYFEPEQIDDVTPLQPGAQTALECQVQYFRPVGQMAVSVLAGCKRSK